jgi:hypothetical protein
LNGRTLLAFACLFAAIVVFRGRMWFTSLSDLAIGLYAYAGQLWLHDHLPYTIVWDYRPPGLFALYAIAIKLFGAWDAPNVLATFALAATTAAVGLLAIRFDPQRRTPAGWWAAVFFVMLAPVNEGAWGAAEVDVTAFIAWSVWFVTKEESSALDVAIAGFLGACALGCKLSAAFLLIPPFIAVLVRAKQPVGAAARGIAFAGGFALPILVVVAIYARAGALATLVDANLWASLRRTHVLDAFYAGNAAAIVPSQLYLLGPQLELAPFALVRRNNGDRLVTWGWFVAAVAAVVVPVEFFPRQFVMLTAPVSLLGALGFVAVLRRLDGRRRAVTVFAAFIVAATFAHDYFETAQTLRYAVHRLALRQHDWREDELSAITRAVRRIAPNERSIYVLEETPYLYETLHAPSPTRYALSELLLDPRLSKTAGIDGAAELRRIFATQPHVVIVSDLGNRRWDPTGVRLVQKILAQRYREVFHDNTVRVYELRSPVHHTGVPNHKWRDSRSALFRRHFVAHRSQRCGVAPSSLLAATKNRSRFVSRHL